MRDAGSETTFCTCTTSWLPRTRLPRARPAPMPPSHDHERKFQVVRDDVAIRETECFQNRDLFALQIQQSREHRIRHERRHAQEDQREPDGERLPARGFHRKRECAKDDRRGRTRHVPRRWTSSGPPRRSPAAFRGTRSQGQRQRIKSAVQVESRSHFLVGHPERCRRCGCPAGPHRAAIRK